MWSGTESERWGDSWAQVERESQREYASQGWAVFPDVPDDPDQLGCDTFTQVGSRVPYPRGDLGADTTDPTTVLQGSLVRTPQGLPLGTRLSVDADPFSVAPGTTTTLTVRARAPQDKALGWSRLKVKAPAGWQVAGDGPLGRLAKGERAVRQVSVTAPDDAADQPPGQRLRDPARAATGSGSSWAELDVVPPVQGTQQLLPQVRQFQQWAVDNGYPQLEGFVEPVLTLASGGSRRVAVQVTNEDTRAARRPGRARPPGRLRCAGGVAAVPATRRRREHHRRLPGDQHRRLAADLQRGRRRGRLRVLDPDDRQGRRGERERCGPRAGSDDRHPRGRAGPAGRRHRRRGRVRRASRST